MESTVSAAATKIPSTDCRVYQRQTCELPTTCQPASVLEMKELRWSAIIADISVGGVRIIAQRRFEKGAGLAIELPGTETRECNVVFVKVVHLKAHENGAWALGCKFISELSEDELQSLLTAKHHFLASAKTAHGSDDPTRAEPALNEIPQDHILTDVRCQIEIQPGSVKNCRIARLDVAKCWPLTPGKILNLQGNTAGQSPWSLRILVTEWNPQERGGTLKGRVVRGSGGADLPSPLGV
jgi:hypothetical protein